MNRSTLLLLPLAFAAMALYVIGCDSAPNPVAPTGTVLTVTANPTKIAPNGETAAITVSGFKPDGNPLNPGTLVTLSSDLGNLASNSLAISSNGRAQTTLTSDGRTGAATVTATLTTGGEATATATVQVEDLKPQLEISANPSTIPVLDTSTITIFARDSNGFLLGAGERILLTADLGSVPSEVETDASGRATARFRAGNQSGDGTVTARLGSADSVSTTVNIRAAVASVLLTRQPTTISRTDAGVVITLDVQVRDAQGDPVGGTVVTFDTIGTLDQNPITTNTNGQGTAMLTVTANDLVAVPVGGTFSITASVFSEGNEITDTKLVTVTN